MRVLVACEFSGVVRDAFAARGHEAWSCDILDTDKPGKHKMSDVLEVLNEKWDLMIAHPPCTYLTVAANKYMKPEYAERFPNRPQQREKALDFMRALLGAEIPMICVENPVGVANTIIRKPDQIIQPYHFGHPDRKTTCLWLKNLPPLSYTKVVEPNIVKNRNGKTASAHHDAALRLPANERWKVRSKTYQGIADAMADQWGEPR